MRQTNFEDTKVVLLTAPVAVTGDTTSDACDLTGFESASFFVAYGADTTPPDGSNHWGCRLTECATVGGSYTDVAAADVDATANLFGVVNSASDDNAVYGIAYKGTMPFIKVELNETGAASTVACIFAVLGHPSKGPVANVVQGT